MTTRKALSPMKRLKPLVPKRLGKRTAQQEAISQGMRFYWKKRKAAEALVPKRTGKMLCKKGPERDEKHLAKVRRQKCLLCVAAGNSPDIGAEAHHVRCIGPRTLGKRVSDYFTVPLCQFDHRLLHQDKEELFWKEWGIDPAEWIARFSKKGRAALERIEQRGRSEIRSTT